MYDYLAPAALPNSIEIKKAFVLIEEKLKQYQRIQVTLTGSDDSDILLDIIEKCRQPHNAIYYTFYNTGLNFEATLQHLKYLEKKYGIVISREVPKKTIQIACKQYGVPFISKQISDYIARLQAHGFKWEDKPLDVLVNKYPNCKAALKWWCNEWGENSQYNINKRKGLKEFLIANPPKFKISTKCCDYNQTKVLQDSLKRNQIQLVCDETRKETLDGRTTDFKTCFSNDKEIDRFRPIFYFSEKDKVMYKEFFDLKYSDCYEKYGIKNIKCAGCPLNRDIDLKLIEQYEPNFFKLIKKTFEEALDYQEKYYKER